MSRTDPRGPVKGKTSARLMAYFKANPDEELTIADAAIKIGAGEHTLRSAVLRLSLAGSLECVRIIRLPEKGRAQHAPGWSNGPGVNGSSGGCDVEVAT